MSRRWVSVAAWVVGGLAIAITIGSIVVWAVTDAPLDSLSFPDPGLALAFPLVGALIASRRPENSVGWVMLTTGAGAALSVASGTYAYAAHVTWPGLPGEAWAGWLQNWAWSIPFVLIANVLLVVFPDGEVRERRWRVLVVISLANLGVILMGTALHPTVESGIGGTSVPTPFPLTLPLAVAEGLEMVGFLFGLVLMIVCVAGLVRRFRRSSGVLRLQLSWFTYGYVVAAVVVIGTVVVGGTGSEARLGLEFVDAILGALALASIAVGVGIAVLRYRLYDIGRLVNRTIVYALVTTVLVALYAVLVVGIGTALGRTSSPVLIAGATLVVAAAAGPLRRRIQALIDRRFYRRRYDAERTLAEFGARLRDQVDPEELRALLRRAADETVQPASVAVWIRGANS